MIPQVPFEDNYPRTAEYLEGNHDEIPDDSVAQRVAQRAQRLLVLATAECDPFGPEYPKINTIWKRDSSDHKVIPGSFSEPEFQYLRKNGWLWTEKVDGTNIRLHWNGSILTIGGRTDNADVSKKLIANLEPQTDTDLWKRAFDADCDDITVYGEGYGAGIQKGGQYRPDQSVVIFDVKVGGWWLKPDDVRDVAEHLGLEYVPIVGIWDLFEAWDSIRRLGEASWTESEGLWTPSSHWPGAKLEGYVGRPIVDLFNRAGKRIITKIKMKDYIDLVGPKYQR